VIFDKFQNSRKNRRIGQQIVAMRIPRDDDQLLILDERIFEKSGSSLAGAVRVMVGGDEENGYSDFFSIGL
jgi:hypothetical protein